MITFCNRCHRRLQPKINISTSRIAGRINVTCGYCKKGKGVIVGTAKKPEQIDVQAQSKAPE